MRLSLLLLSAVFCIHAIATPAQAIETKAKQAIMVDESTGTVLLEKNADELMHPSSMSKLMTLSMLLKRLKEGGLKLDDTFTVSEKAWRMQGSKMFVELGNQISVEDLIRGIVIQSGNDACIVVAEGMAGSEEAFATQLNELSKELGLSHSHFTNATGWPDDDHLMTARDLYKLAHHLIYDLPEYYHYFAEESFVYHGIKQPNRNLLLHRGIGVDGLKTGHTEAGGYGIVVSAKQGERRVTLVVNGLSSESERAQEAEALVRAAFRDFESKKIISANKPVAEAEVWFGESTKVPLGSNEDMIVTLPRGATKKAKFTLKYTGPLQAPVKAGDHVADLEINIDRQMSKTVPLVALNDVDKLSGFSRLLPAIYYYIFQK